jgi:hypothetical protein
LTHPADTRKLTAMTDPRMQPWFGQHAGARYRCRVCRRFVRATDRGVCPSCGMPPPSFASVAPPAAAPAAWPRWLGRAVVICLNILALAAFLYVTLH